MKAKTKLNYIFNLLVIIGVVFAFSVGATFASIPLSISVGTQQYSIKSYLAKQEYVVINDSATTPIAFGLGNRLSEVSIQYSYSYDFDIRIKYSLSWSNSASTDNVILRFSNRDNLIVDNEYIYYKDSISAGSGILKIITGVDFIDPTDNSYLGASLTINVDEVKIYKAQDSYTTSHELCKYNSIDISTTEACKAWIWYKNRANQPNAYVMAYNLRSTYANGVSHPNGDGAYSRSKVTASDGTTKDVASWIGGNRAYAGMSIYVMAGSSDITLSVSVTGMWVDDENVGASAAAITINNIKYNYASDWSRVGYSSDHVFENYNYDYKIKAGETAFIEIVDSVEITCAANLEQADYSRYRVVNSIVLNNLTFVYGAFGSDKITSSSALSSSDANSVETAYTTKNITLNNTTTYNPALYNKHTSGLQTFYGNASLTNNTANTLTVTLSYSINIYISNGNANLFTNNNNNYTYGTEYSGPLWYREKISSTSSQVLTVTNKQATLTVAPYSSAEIMQSFSVNASSLIGSYNNSDAWVEVIVSCSSATTTENKNVSVEIGISNNNYVLSVKNNTDKVLTGITTNMLVIERKATYTLTPAQPTDWLSTYWQYYTKSGDVYTRVSAKTAPAWATNTYYSVSYGDKSPTLSNNIAKNGFTYSTSTFNNASLVLQPGESVVMAEIAKPTKAEYVFTFKSGTSILGATASTASEQSIAISFNGSTNAYIYNNTSSSYYVKFTGTLSGTKDYIATVNSVNYYLGVVRPGQIIKIPLSSSATLTTSVAGDVYSLPSGWDSSVDSIYKAYFDN